MTITSAYDGMQIKFKGSQAVLPILVDQNNNILRLSGEADDVLHIFHDKLLVRFACPYQANALNITQTYFESNKQFEVPAHNLNLNLVATVDKDLNSA